MREGAAGGGVARHARGCVTRAAGSGGGPAPGTRLPTCPIPYRLWCERQLARSAGRATSEPGRRWSRQPRPGRCSSPLAWRCSAWGTAMRSALGGSASGRPSGCACGRWRRRSCRWRNGRHGADPSGPSPALAHASVAARRVPHRRGGRGRRGVPRDSSAVVAATLVVTASAVWTSMVNTGVIVTGSRPLTGELGNAQVPEPGVGVAVRLLAAVLLTISAAQLTRTGLRASRGS